MSRLGLVVSFISVIALVAFLASVSDEKSSGAELLASARVPKGKLPAQVDKETLATSLLTTVLHSNPSTPKKLKEILRVWRDHQISHLDPFSNTQVLPSCPCTSFTK